MLDVDREHERPTPSALSDQAGGQGEKIHKRHGAGGFIGCVVDHRIFGAEPTDIHADPAAVRVGPCAFVGGLVNRFDVVFFDRCNEAVRQGLESVEVAGTCEHASSADEAPFIQHPVEILRPVRAKLRSVFRGGHEGGEADEDIFRPAFHRPAVQILDEVFLAIDIGGQLVPAEIVGVAGERAAFYFGGELEVELFIRSRAVFTDASGRLASEGKHFLQHHRFSAPGMKKPLSSSGKQGLTQV